MRPQQLAHLVRAGAHPLVNDEAQSDQIVGCLTHWNRQAVQQQRKDDERVARPQQSGRHCTPLRTTTERSLPLKDIGRMRPGFNLFMHEQQRES